MFNLRMNPLAIDRLASGLKAAALGLALLGVSAAFSGPAEAYSASQAEAQSDPSTDPYTFPNIKPCCGIAEPKPVCPPRGCHPVRPHRPVYRPKPHKPKCPWAECPPNGPHYPGPDRPYPPHEPPSSALTVTCGVQGPYGFGSIQQAVYAARPGQTILVYGGFPGQPCRESVRINKGVRIVGVGDPSAGQSRATLLSEGGFCLRVEGYASVMIENMEIISEGGGLCVDQAAGRLDMHNVSISAPRASAAIAVSSGYFGARSLAVIGGGTAFAASNASVVIRDAQFTRQEGDDVPPYVAPPMYAPSQPYNGYGAPAPQNGYGPNGYGPNGYAPNGYPAPGARIDPNAAYNGGGAVYSYSHREPSYGPNGYGPNGYGQNGNYQPPAYDRHEIDGKAVVLLNGARAELTNVTIAGGPVGLQAVMFGWNSERPVTLQGVRIIANPSGKDVGIQVLSNGGYGYASPLNALSPVIDGYRNGIEIRGAIAQISGASIRATRDGIVADRGAAGIAERNSISFDDDCICIDGRCSSSDQSNGRFTARGNACLP